MQLKYGVPAYSSSVDAGRVDAWSLCLAHHPRSGLPPNVAQGHAHTKAWQQPWPNLSWWTE
ncbi:hypothetical protein [uncultured Deefgea sp.]|uniref:hypothetical protein n=1 Tax=uncultured Deefgea sp. TaxID=1304914 RepID=UPI002602F3BD|nr:hypothetical protein [uncultured Deefgea sp.]